MSDWNDKMIAEFRGNNGTAGRFGRGLVVMHTIGAKSGEERLVPVASMPTDNGWLVISPEGHYRGSPDVEKEIVYVVQTDRGQETLSPEEFAKIIRLDMERMGKVIKEAGIVDE